MLLTLDTGLSYTVVYVKNKRSREYRYDENLIDYLNSSFMTV